MREEKSRVLIGGVGYRWMGDASFGLSLVDELMRRERPAKIDVADLGYGALYVVQDLCSMQPPCDRLILVAGVERGRPPGRLYRYRWKRRPVDAEELQARIREAGAGVIDLDHLLLIADHFGALPEEVEVIEFEPLDTTLRDQLSPQATALREQLIEGFQSGAAGMWDTPPVR